MRDIEKQQKSQTRKKPKKMNELCNLFINQLALEKIGLQKSTLWNGLGFDFSYKKARLHLSIHDDNRVFISYRNSFNTIMQSKCKTMEELKKLFELLDQLIIIPQKVK